MDILFQCPECKGKALVQMTDEEATEVKQRIQTEGRSPTLIVRCENNHELLVTLFNQRGGGGLGVRDIVVPHRADKEESKPDEKKSSEIDWLSKAFGG
ncbi:MAG: hypothetical protein RTU63_12685 [Candidatus Thorarchaeota archaeon]